MVRERSVIFLPLSAIFPIIRTVRDIGGCPRIDFCYDRL